MKLFINGFIVMKKIVLLLNATLPALHILQYGLSQARNSGCFLHIILVHDHLSLQEYDYPFPNDLSLTRNRLTGLSLVEEDILLVENNVSNVIHMCKTANIHCFIDPERSWTPEKLLECTSYADCLLADADEDMQRLYMAELLVHTHCPVLLLPKTFVQPAQVLLTYDGRSSALLALKMFAYIFPEYLALPTTLLHVSSGDERAIPKEEALRTLASTHYKALEVKTIHGSARTALPAYVSSLPSPIITMGSFGRNAVSRFFKKSIASVLIEQRKAAVFIAHD
ncbi:MAG TPA: hypothetical protein VL307_02085 [Chitinophagaceae bacterium]|nr:hypothetical protein [Chitinophagaceae bacterium]